MKKIALLALPLPLILAACGEDPAATKSTADQLAALDSVSKVVEITEDNDPNNLIGRPDGYDAAWVFHVQGLDQCQDGTRVECGMTLEQWGSEDEAQARADYIATIAESAPMLANEYDYVDGPMLLRVTGEIKPSDAKRYQEAFTG
jgi:predicted ABC-type transport system involved in lysophospholipase L1 biosynthesis ATPase subunit